MGYNIVITGVGGQGVLVASQIIANAAIYKDMNVRVGETHGMAQRGGSVIAHVRFGDGVYGSITPEGQGDVLLAFEPLESLRFISYMRDGASAIVNNHPLVPVSVTAGAAKYPRVEDILERVRTRLDVTAIDATALADKAGNSITSNTVMIGAFSRIAEKSGIPLEKDVLLEAVRKRIPERFHSLNEKAFLLGYKQASI